MSWKERLTDIRFTIVTGDGRTFTPFWVNGETSVEFNTKKYEFINVDKSLIDRKRAQSSNYPLTFYFQGDDNIDQATAFFNSAKDPRAWEVTHPFYGTINGQPTGMNRNDTNYNVSVVTVDFWESISEDYPNNRVSAKDVIQNKVGVVNAAGLTTYVSGAKPTTANIPTIKVKSGNIASKFNRLQTPSTFTRYTNQLSKTVKSADNLIAAPEDAILNNQELLMIPSTYDMPVIKRINAIYLAYLEVRAAITGKNDKYYFETIAATAIAAISQAAVNPQQGDYMTRPQVNETTDILIATYEDYLTTVDNAQVGRFDPVNEWTPSPQVQEALYDLVTDTVSNLYQLAFGAKQERIVEVDTDTNLILLTHKYMGLDVEDANIEAMRTINNIKNDEVFKIKKGRMIKYFI
jgi:hypothetical protein